jgi:hypothetical protein
MTNSELRGSAKIYQFPVRPRTGTGGQSGQVAADRILPLPDVSEHVIDDAWYHQAAIQESRRAGER